MIYVITTFTKLQYNPERERFDFGSIRTIGYYLSLETAQEVIKNNQCDIWETCYDYALIEGIEEGLYPVFPYQELYQIENHVMIKDGKEYANPNATYKKMELPEKFPKYCLSIG